MLNQSRDELQDYPTIFETSGHLGKFALPPIGAPSFLPLVPEGHDTPSPLRVRTGVASEARNIFPPDLSPKT